MSICDKCKLKDLNIRSCEGGTDRDSCYDFIAKDDSISEIADGTNNNLYANDPVNAPQHYVGKIECIDYLRDKLTPEEFAGFCMGNVLKYCSRWRKKDGVQDLKKAKVYLDWAIENEEKKDGKA